MFLKSFFTVKFISKEFIVLLVVLLDVGSNLFRMGLLQGFDCFVVSLELCKLPFVFLHALVKPTLQLFNLAAELAHLRPMLFFDGLLFTQQALLVLLELLQTFPLLLCVTLLELLDLCLPCFAFLRMCEGLFLPGYYLIRTVQKSFYFFLICVGHSSLHSLILLVFAM